MKSRRQSPGRSGKRYIREWLHVALGSMCKATRAKTRSQTTRGSYRLNSGAKRTPPKKPGMKNT